jgi:2-amino-4-hydroxy-6-hydroxymethyldihydropteridine diphosphokinase
MQLVARSRWYRSAAVPPSGQPDYVNGTVRLAGDVEPSSLLARLHAIEAEAGRVRTVRDAARILDLDLLAMDDVIMTGPPVLPHPRLHERAFVLLPLLDIAPGWVHPRLGQRAADMAAALQPSGCDLLDRAALAPPVPSD